MQALLGTPDIEILDILTINCHTIDAQEANSWFMQYKHSQLLQFSMLVIPHKHDAGS